ncbi:hypothetical protein [Streptomyces canus]|uniref:hypothetical protein n=1 Tax=Streptomyces canus TaxID=58343 RepID=UPI00386D433A|nr:hypothetical protein OH824_14035 [Streptomyces canus]
MSATAIVIDLMIAALLLLAGALLLGMCRAAAAADRAAERQAQAHGTTVWDDRIGEWMHLPAGVQPGPSQYTAADVAALDQLVIALDAPAFAPATDPQWAAGRARLLADLNEQTGDQL